MPTCLENDPLASLGELNGRDKVGADRLNRMAGGELVGGRRMAHAMSDNYAKPND